MAQLQGVTDTTFIPMAARIYASKKFPGYFFDEVARGLEGKVPVEGILATSSEYALMASVARYRNMDRMAAEFIGRHGDCSIVNLGAGLETMSHRLKAEGVLFFEVDLPETIERRLSVLGETEGEVILPGDMFSFEWAGAVDASRPTLFVVSGVFQYFEVEKVDAFIRELARRFPGGELIFDSTSRQGLVYANKYVEKTGNRDALMHYYVDDPEELARKTGTTLLEAPAFFTEARRLPGRKLYTRIAMAIADRGNRGLINHLAFPARPEQQGES